MSLPREAEELGRYGEKLRRLELNRDMGRGSIRFYCRPEWIVVDKDWELRLEEVKTQSKFNAPPFDGHGLPVLQVERYIQLHRTHGMRTLLTIYDADEPFMYQQYVDVLERGDHFDTSGSVKGKSRRVYPLTSYDRFDLPSCARTGTDA